VVEAAVHFGDGLHLLPFRAEGRDGQIIHGFCLFVPLDLLLWSVALAYLEFSEGVDAEFPLVGIGTHHLLDYVHLSVLVLLSRHTKSFLRAVVVYFLLLVLLVFWVVLLFGRGVVHGTAVEGYFEAIRDLFEAGIEIDSVDVLPSLFLLFFPV
jgi:hypothetical protein